jgi:LuxR family maltose regulon positive regulatory protein
MASTTGIDAVLAEVPLLETKYRAPRRRSNAVGRPRLDSRMTGPDAPTLTLVSAPAGFGKTTVITEWLARATTAGHITAWLSLDPRDNDPTLFWSYLTASLGSAGAIGADAPALLQVPQTPIDAVVTTVVNELNQLERDVVVVLDDYHVIESAQVQQSVLLLLEHLPPRVRLVVATRSDPPWPLGQWRARGDLVEIRAVDLRFTADEASDYLADAMGLAISADDVAALEGRTEGWIAALQLAALSMQGRDDIAGFIEEFTGDDRYIVDYLVEEVLQRQSPDDREFLLRTSVLDRLSGSLCDAVTGATGSKARLDALDRANLFLVALDDRRHWYRYHHLFADVLRARLLDERPDDVALLHRRASAWFDQHGERSEAIRHAIAAADFERAAELVELTVPLMRQTRQEATLRGWLDALPDELLVSRPVLRLALAGAWMASGQLERAAALLDEIEQSIAADTGTGGPTRLVVDDELEFRRLPAQVALYRAAMALVAGDLDATTSQAQRALEVVDGDDHLGRGAATALIGLARWTAGDLEGAQRLYADAIASLEAAGHLSDALGCRLTLSDIQTARGRLGEAMSTVEVGLAATEGRGTVRGTADMHVAIADLLRERNDLDGALHHLEAGRALGDAMGLPRYPHRWNLAMSGVRRAQGDLDTALGLVATAARLYNGDYSPDVRPVAAVEARLRIAAGDPTSARRWVVDHGITTDDELTYLREFEHLTLARALLVRAATSSSSDGGGELSRFLERLLADAEQGGRAGSAIEVLALQALHAHAMGDLDTALARLETALERAEPEGFVRVFLDEGAPMTALLRTAAARGARSERARALLAAADRVEPPGGPRTQTGLVDPLSARELEVLRLLRTDLTGPEIARELLVSLNTMRTHTKAIYLKLGVNSRRAAVSRADQLGL